jgi:Na+-driven multidrug efflux pump
MREPIEAVATETATDGSARRTLKARSRVAVRSILLGVLVSIPMGLGGVLFSKQLLQAMNAVPWPSAWPQREF